MLNPVACYVGGKGMFASEPTWSFKVSVFKCLRETQLGYDCRHRYYRALFPDMPDNEFDRMVCDPIEYYDPDWTTQRAQYDDENADAMAITRFWLQRDLAFQAQATVGIFGLDEPGFGTAINIARFLDNKKPVSGFYNPALSKKSTQHNFHNLLQLTITHPTLFSLNPYEDENDLRQQLTAQLMQ